MSAEVPEIFAQTACMACHGGPACTKKAEIIMLSPLSLKKVLLIKSCRDFTEPVILQEIKKLNTE